MPFDYSTHLTYISFAHVLLCLSIYIIYYSINTYTFFFENLTLE